VIRSGEMPEKGKPLAEAQLAVIEKWIAARCQDGEAGAARAGTGTDHFG
jgi:hypothetical protein